MALWGAHEVASLILASLVAGLATTPYAAYHFHRLAPYGVLANLLAMPVVSGVVMPMGILGVLSMPFGFDAAFWQMMGQGIEWMNAVALSDACRLLGSVHSCWEPQACCSFASCARRFVGVALLLQQARSPGPWRLPNPTF
jgi:competence protein ComEC